MLEISDDLINLNIEKEQNLLLNNEENTIYEKDEKKVKPGHIKMQSFEVSTDLNFNKKIPIKSREQTIQANEINIKNKDNFSNSTRNTGQSIVVEEKIDQNEDSNNNLFKTKTKNRSSSDNEGKNKKIYFYDKIPVKIMRIITIIMIIIYIITGIISVFFFTKERDNRPYLFCFNFIKRDEPEKEQSDKEYDIILFLSDLNSFCLIHIVLLLILIFLLFTLIKNQENNVKNFFKDASIFFDLTLFVNILTFCLGIVSNYNNESQYWKTICFIILTGLGTLFMLKVYIKTKSNKYKNITRLINQGILSGILASFELYSFIYNICFLTTWGTGLKNIIKMEIIPGSIYFIIGFFFTIFYKDIIFSITMLILETGLLYIKKNDALSVVIFNISAVFFNFSTIILTIFKYNKKVFNLEEVIETKKNK